MRLFKIFLAVLFAVMVSGCSVVFQKGRRSDVERIKMLEDELSRLKDTKSILEDRLSREIEDKQVKLTMEDKGLVVTFVAEVLFDPGKAELKKDSLPILSKVADILKEEEKSHNISIEGHTDNQPIKYSGWKSNWELSSHRALGVLTYLEQEGVSPERMAATGYGEYKPVASNDSAEGRAVNRRVEIVIIPNSAKKITGGESGSYTPEREELK